MKSYSAWRLVRIWLRDFLTLPSRPRCNKTSTAFLIYLSLLWAHENWRCIPRRGWHNIGCFTAGAIVIYSYWAIRKTKSKLLMEDSALVPPLTVEFNNFISYVHNCMDCCSDFKSVLMEVNFWSTPESTVVKALKYSTPSLNFCLRFIWCNELMCQLRSDSCYATLSL